MGLGYDNEESERVDKKKHKFDVSKYDVIVFEEIFFNESWLLSKPYEFMLEHNNKIFLANGDGC